MEIVNNIKNRAARETVKAFMERYGTSQNFMARQIGLSQSTISRWLKEEINLRDNNLDKILKFTDFP